jgi:hypothetical protein
MAESMMSGRLVAAMTKMPSRTLSPSSSVSSVLTTRLAASEAVSSRRGTRASSSSKNRMHGTEERARVKTCRTARSDSPTYYRCS